MKTYLTELYQLVENKNRSNVSKFFKTGVGEYAFGDKFIGVSVPHIRTVAIKYFNQLNFEELSEILESAIHEERLFALLCLVEKFDQTKELETQKSVAKFYLQEAAKQHINNWDLVDLSAYKILGEYFFQINDVHKLYKLAKSKSMWERRIAVVSTFAFIKRNVMLPTLDVCTILLEDKENLIHKACGWMLREVGKRNKTSLMEFLELNAHTMPRIMLSYALEKFNSEEKIYYRNL